MNSRSVAEELEVAMKTDERVVLKTCQILDHGEGLCLGVCTRNIVVNCSNLRSLMDSIYSPSRGSFRLEFALVERVVLSQVSMHVPEQSWLQQFGLWLRLLLLLSDLER